MLNDTTFLTNITLAVLAGGEGRRMNQPKATLQLNGRPILQALLERLQWPGPTLLVTAPGRENPAGAEMFSAQAVDRVSGDAPQFGGPMRGVLTALQSVQTPLAIVVPVDMPNLSTKSLYLLASVLNKHPRKAAAMFQRYDGDVQRLEPLPAAFATRSGTAIVARLLAEGKTALRDLSQSFMTAHVECPKSWPRDFWVNLNRPEDVETYQSLSRTGVAE